MYEEPQHDRGGTARDQVEDLAQITVDFFAKYHPQFSSQLIQTTVQSQKGLKIDFNAELIFEWPCN